MLTASPHVVKHDVQGQRLQSSPQDTLKDVKEGIHFITVTFLANVDLPHGRLFYTKIIMCYKQLNNRKKFLFIPQLTLFFTVGPQKKDIFCELTETFCF